jgi:predicted ATP-grasp superfamily ATP-dependent carboligase
VVKASREGTSCKTVSYCTTHAELSTATAWLLTVLRGRAEVLIQEFIKGAGFGFFALMNHGAPLRVFMHQRIREYPPSGGRSTAARAYYSPRLKDLGLRLLSALKWHGVAMVEFKYSESRADFVLMEINGKFWGSLELGLSAGVNFGADLIRLFRGETLSYSEQYERDWEFYWPLDDDLLTLLKTGDLRRVGDYWKPNAHTNLGQSLRSDLIKSLRLASKIVGELLPSFAASRYSSKSRERADCARSPQASPLGE